MSVLFDLPSDLYNEVCSIWLKRAEMLKLDSAFCQTLRPTLISQWQEKSMIFTGYHLNYHKWIYARHIPLRKLELWRQLFDKDTGCLLCNIRLDKVEELQVQYLELKVLPQVQQIISACTNLKAIDWKNDRFELLDCEVKSVKLTSLKISESVKSLEKLFEWILGHCYHLQSLQLCGNTYSEQSSLSYLQFFKLILEQNSLSLTRIELRAHGNIFTEIIKACPNVQYVHIATTDFDFSQISPFINKFVNITLMVSTFKMVFEYNGSTKQLIIRRSSLESASLTELMNCFECLDSLDIDVTENITDNFLYNIAVRFQHTLKSFRISGSRTLTKQGLYNVFSLCSSLEYFESSCINLTFEDVAISMIDAKMLRLKKIFTYLITMTYDMMIQLLSASPLLNNVNVIGSFEDRANRNSYIKYLKAEKLKGRIIVADIQ